MAVGEDTNSVHAKLAIGGVSAAVRHCSACLAQLDTAAEAVESTLATATLVREFARAAIRGTIADAIYTDRTLTAVISATAAGLIVEIRIDTGTIAHQAAATAAFAVGAEAGAAFLVGKTGEAVGETIRSGSKF